MRNHDGMEPERLDDLVDGRAQPKGPEEEALVAMLAGMREDAQAVTPSPELRACVRGLSRAREPGRRRAWLIGPAAAAVAAGVAAVLVVVTRGGDGPSPAPPVPAPEAVAPGDAARAQTGVPGGAPVPRLPATGEAEAAAVVPGVGIDGVRLGMAPAAAARARRAAPTVRVVVGGDGRVSAVRTTDPAYRTAEGVGVGTTVARVRAALPGVSCAAGCTAPGLRLTLAGGRVTAVEVVPG